MAACPGLSNVYPVIGSRTVAAIGDGSFSTATFASLKGMVVVGDVIYALDYDGTNTHLRKIDFATSNVTTIHVFVGQSARWIRVGPVSGRLYVSYGTHGAAMLVSFSPATPATQTTVFAGNGTYGFDLNGDETVIFVSLNSPTGFGDQGNLHAYSLVGGVVTGPALWGHGSGGFFDNIVEVLADPVSGFVYSTTTGVFGFGWHQVPMATGTPVVNHGGGGTYYATLIAPATWLQGTFPVRNTDVATEGQRWEVLAWPTVVRCEIPHTAIRPAGYDPRGVVMLDDRVYIGDRSVLLSASGGGWKVGQISIG